MVDHPTQASRVDKQALLNVFSPDKRPRTHAEIGIALGLEINQKTRALLSRRVGQLVRQGLIVQVESPELLRRLGAAPENHDGHSKFWAVAADLPEDVRQELAARAAALPATAKLTDLGAVLEAQWMASGIPKHAFLRGHGIDPRVWWRLITPGQERPRQGTVVKYATLVGADVARALRAAGYEPGLGGQEDQVGMTEH